jgi:hypothetical protein
MAGDPRWQAIPTQLELAEFEQFILPHLSPGARGPAPKLSLHKIFNYVLKHVYLGCQWKELPIDKDRGGRLRRDSVSVPLSGSPAGWVHLVPLPGPHAGRA